MLHRVLFVLTLVTVGAPLPCRAQCAAGNFGCKSWMEGGLRGRIFYLPPQTHRLPDLTTLTPRGTIFTRQLNVPTRAWEEGFPGVTDRFEWFAIEYTGFIRPARQGHFTFRLVSDDGSKLFIDDHLVINNDGEHPTVSRSGDADLNAGQHVIRIQYFQGPRYNVALQFFCKPEGGPEHLFPDCSLGVTTDVNRTLTPVTPETKPVPPPVESKSEATTPGKGQVGSPMTITAKVTGNTPPPGRMIAEVDGEKVILNPARTPGDGTYVGTWTPKTPGQKKIHLTPDGGGPMPPLDIEATVDDKPAPPPPPPPPPSLAQPGELSFGSGVPLNFGRLRAGDTGQGEGRLSGGKVTRDVDIEISTDFEKRHATLQIETPAGWQTLSSTPLKARLNASDPFHWPLRLQVGKCPEVCKPDEVHHVNFVAHITDGSTQHAEVPLQLEITPEPWYICWKVELLSALAAIIGGFIAYGFISPYRFGRRAGVQLSPAEDPAEGFFFPFRAARGSRAGFYRDARLYLTEDFRVQGSKTGGFVRLRADRDMVRIRPENGRSVYRQQADGSWELLSANQETISRPGALYRNDARTLYFDIRTK